MSFRYMDKTKWHEIERGYVFDAATFYPSDSSRPLSFFIRDEPQSDRGCIVSSDGDFKPTRIDGRMTAVEHEVIVRLKPRKVVDISHNRFNQDTDYDFVYMAPIMSVSQMDRQKAWYPKIKKDDHPVFVLYPNPKNNIERYIDVSQITYIHKSMLLSKVEAVPDHRMALIEQNMLECFDLGIVEEAPEIANEEASNQ